ncbi:MAG: hypothetical protein ABSB96_05255 [Gaiellaceae bacterium]
MAKSLRASHAPVLLIAFTLISLLVPVIARANGGTSIAMAPELPVGSPVSGAVTGLDYWAISVGAGDELAIDFEAVTEGVGFCFMRPGVTDYTLADTPCWQPKNTDYADEGEKRETKRVFGVAGRWTLIVGETEWLDWGCVQDVVYPQCDRSTTYQLTAYLHKFTRVVAKAPRFVKLKKRFKLAGQVVGAAGGGITIQERLHRKWKNLGIAMLKADGRFVYSIRPRAPGLHRYRVYYPGDQGHRASTAAVKVSVVKRR